jgi:hypothetical protein
MNASDKRVVGILAELRALGSAKDRAGMARYGINVDNAFGVSIYELRAVASRSWLASPSTTRRRPTKPS